MKARKNSKEDSFNVLRSSAKATQPQQTSPKSNEKEEAEKMLSSARAKLGTKTGPGSGKIPQLERKPTVRTVHMYGVMKHDMT